MDAHAVSGSYPWYRLRCTQYDRVYVSPHMDDAIYSCGGQIALERAAGKRVLIVTVFGDGLSSLARPRARFDTEPAPGSPDLRSRAQGRASTKDLFLDTEQRKREERAAVERLDVDHLWLNYPDLLARPKRVGALMRYGLPFVALPPDALQAQIYAALAALSERFLAGDGTLFFPLGVGAHPDHRIVHAVGQAFAANSRERVVFYEDIPYAHVRALRDDRLRALGLPRASTPLVSAREVHAFVFARSPDWQRAIALPLVTGHTLFVSATQKLLASVAPQRATVRAHDLLERVIDDVVEKKVEAMRAYATQTAFFFPQGEAIYDVLAHSDGHYVERYWTLSRVPASALTRGHHGEAERARADALMREVAAAGVLS